MNARRFYALGAMMSMFAVFLSSMFIHVAHADDAKIDHLINQVNQLVKESATQQNVIERLFIFTNETTDAFRQQLTQQKQYVERIGNNTTQNFNRTIENANRLSIEIGNINDQLNVMQKLIDRIVSQPTATGAAADQISHLQKIIFDKDAEIKKLKGDVVRAQVGGTQVPPPPQSEPQGMASIDSNCSEGTVKIQYYASDGSSNVELSECLDKGDNLWVHAGKDVFMRPNLGSLNPINPSYRYNYEHEGLGIGQGETISLKAPELNGKYKISLGTGVEDSNGDFGRLDNPYFEFTLTYVNPDHVDKGYIQAPMHTCAVADNNASGQCIEGVIPASSGTNCNGFYGVMILIKGTAASECHVTKTFPNQLTGVHAMTVDVTVTDNGGNYIGDGIAWTGSIELSCGEGYNTQRYRLTKNKNTVSINIKPLVDAINENKDVYCTVGSIDVPFKTEWKLTRSSI